MSNTVSPITGNQYFSVVKNLEVDPTHLLKGVESVVTALQVPESSGALPVATPITGTYALSDAELSSFVNPGFLLLDGDGLTGVTTLTLGADTAARALQLIRLLKLNQNTPSRLLKFEQVAGANTAFALSMGNTSATALHIKCSLAGGTPAAVVQIMESLAVGNVYVVASLTSPATSQPVTDPAILFNVVRAGFAT